MATPRRACGDRKRDWGARSRMGNWQGKIARPPYLTPQTIYLARAPACPAYNLQPAKKFCFDLRAWLGSHIYFNITSRRPMSRTKTWPSSLRSIQLHVANGCERRICQSIESGKCRRHQFFGGAPLADTADYSAFKVSEAELAAGQSDFLIPEIS